MKTSTRFGLYFGLMAVVALYLGIGSAMAKSITLKYASMNPTTAWIHDHSYLPWAKKVEEATEGRVKVKIYPAQTLGKVPAFYDLVKSGIADLAFGVQAYNAGQFPLSDLMTLPFLDSPSAAVTARVMWEIYEKFPEVQEEYKDIKLLHFVATEPYLLLTLSQPVRNLNDIKGLKLRVPGGRMAATIKALGAVPMSIPMPELYISLEKGVIDGTGLLGEAYMGQVPREKLKHATIGTRLWSTVFWVGMNQRTWNRLSKEDQEAIMSVSGRTGSEWFAKTCFDDARVAAIEEMKRLNTNIYQLPEEERAKWKKIAKPIHADYVAELEAKGLPAQKVYDEIIRLLKEYSK